MAGLLWELVKGMLGSSFRKKMVLQTGRQKIGGRNLGEGMQGSSHKLADEPQSLGFFSAGKLKALIEVEHL